MANVVLTITDDKQWKPAKTGEQIFLALVEYAKTSRARCRKCSEAIEKGEIRVGMPIRWRGGEYGWISAWSHLKCTRVLENTIDQEFDESYVYGLENLKKEREREKVMEELSKREPPEHLKPLDPTDPSFIKRGPLAPVIQPRQILRPMLRYQLEGLGWMMNQEQKDIKGGILADEMGMGKTLQAISLLVKSKANGVTGPTLIICPTSAMSQWKDEILAFTPPDTLSVCIYYGQTQRSLTAEKLEKYDVVLTTYPVIEINYRTIINKLKEECQYCHRKFLPRVLIVHQMYFCGPNSKRSDKLMKRMKKNEENEVVDMSIEHAKRTLRITSKDEYASAIESARNLGKPQLKASRSLPTPLAVYKELMQEANRDTIGRFEPAPPYIQRNSQCPSPDSPSLSGAGSAPHQPIDLIGDIPVRQTLPRRAKTENISYIDLVSSDDEVAQKHNESETNKSTNSNSAKKSTTKPRKKTNKSRKLDTPHGKNRTRNENADDDDDDDDDDDYKEDPHNNNDDVAEDIDEVDDEVADDDDDEDDASVIRNNKKEEKTPQRSKKPARKRAKKANQDTSEKEEMVDGREEKGKGKKGGKKGVKEEAKEEKTKPKKRGRKRKINVDEEFELDEEDIIEPEESQVLADINAPMNDEIDLSASVLHCIKWTRIILDEAHKIKARTTSTAKSVYGLQSEYKWCITGTPLQNRVGELYSLVRFLRMEPFAFYYCRTGDCKCKRVEWGFGPGNRYCMSCHHPPTSHFSYFNRNIANPIIRYGYVGDGRKSLILLKEKILDEIMLRRTKEERKADVALPPLNINIQHIHLSEEEDDFYKCIYKQSRSKFDTFVEKNTLLHNYAHIFDLLSRLRQAVDHPYLVVHGDYSKKATATGEPVQPIPTRSRKEVPLEVCGICQDDIDPEDYVVSGCKHAFHRECIVEYIEEAPTIEQSVNGNGETTEKQTKRKRPRKTKRKKKNTDDDNEDADEEEENDKETDERNERIEKIGNTMGCPVCFQRLTIDLRQQKISIAGKSGNGEVDQYLSENISAPSLDLSFSFAEEEDDTEAWKNRAKYTKGKSFLTRLKVDQFASSTKIESLINEMKTMVVKDAEAKKKLDQRNAEKKSGEPLEEFQPSKAIVFSQFTNMLDLIEWRLKRSRIRNVKLVGSMPMLQRQSVLKAFRTDPTIQVILLSLKAGGEGLNLQQANYVFLMDPWWNPATEMQAIQRAHRIGQNRPVNAFRFITKDTIEERMLQLQEKKQLVFDGTIDSSAAALCRLNEEDLVFLFKN